MTLYDGDARVELSGATTANWVAKSANLLVDGLGAPDRVGLLLPLHWQAVALLLAAITTGATAVVAAEPAELAGCGVAFVLADHADAALDAGVEDVLALSGHPLGLPAGSLSPLVVDYAREVPSYADHFGGPRPGGARVEVGGRALEAGPSLTAGARLLTTLPPAAGGTAVLVAALRAGASLVLLRSGDAVAVSRAEQVTATAGTDVPGLTRVA